MINHKTRIRRILYTNDQVRVDEALNCYYYTKRSVLPLWHLHVYIHSSSSLKRTKRCHGSRSRQAGRCVYLSKQMVTRQSWLTALDTSSGLNIPVANDTLESCIPLMNALKEKRRHLTLTSTQSPN